MGRTTTEMQIPKKLPQFEKPALFIASGEYEASFWLAFHGMLVKKEQLRLNPREEAKEKQGYIFRSKGKELGATTHHERYREELKKKFQKRIHRLIHDFIAEYKLDELFLFAPNHIIQNILRGLEKTEQRKVRMKFGKEYTKKDPLKMLQEVEKEFQKSAKHLHRPDELFGPAK